MLNWPEVLALLINLLSELPVYRSCWKFVFLSLFTNVWVCRRLVDPFAFALMCRRFLGPFEHLFPQRRQNYSLALLRARRWSQWGRGTRSLELRRSRMPWLGAPTAAHTHTRTRPLSMSLAITYHSRPALASWLIFPRKQLSPPCWISIARLGRAKPMHFRRLKLWRRWGWLRGTCQEASECQETVVRRPARATPLQIGSPIGTICETKRLRSAGILSWLPVYHSQVRWPTVAWGPDWALRRPESRNMTWDRDSRSRKWQKRQRRPLRGRKRPT